MSSRYERYKNFNRPDPPEEPEPKKACRNMAIDYLLVALAIGLAVYVILMIV